MELFDKIIAFVFAVTIFSIALKHTGTLVNIEKQIGSFTIFIIKSVTGG